MPLLVVATAEPGDIQRPGVVVVVGVDHHRPADGARAARQLTALEGGSHGVVREELVSVALVPAELRGWGLTRRALAPGLVAAEAVVEVGVEGVVDRHHHASFGPRPARTAMALQVGTDHLVRRYTSRPPGVRPGSIDGTVPGVR
jgi:hypothetical protein